MKNMYKAALAWGIMIYFPFFFSKAYAIPVSPECQEFLAADYSFQIMQTADTAEREALYLRLIEECPETELAEESYWALSNLYLDDFDEAQEDKAKNILELFLKRYPKSRWVEHADSRLQWLRGQAARIP